MGLALHTADIANPAKPRQLSLAWTEMCMEEFFTQVTLTLSLTLILTLTLTLTLTIHAGRRGEAARPAHLTLL